MTDERAIKLDPLADIIPAVEATFQREAYSLELVEELLPLLVVNHAETSSFKDIPLAPMWDYYEAYEQKRVLRAFTVRVGTRLVGYSIWLIGHNLHQGTILQANMDVTYLSPEVRGRYLGLKFLRWCIAILREEGIVSFTLGIKLSKNHVTGKTHNWGPMAERLGFKAQEVVYRMGEGINA